MTTHRLVYLVGAPGVGKTTLMTMLTASCARDPQDKPFAHDVLTKAGRPVGIELGRRRGTFSGTDALSMSVQPAAARWIRTRPHPLILAEGARLATAGFLHAARAAGYRITIVHLGAPTHLLRQRRAERGSNQNEQWMNGAATRARKIAARMELDATVHRLTADQPAAVLAQTVVALIPELEDLCWI